MTIALILSLIAVLYVAWHHFVLFGKRKDVPYGELATLPVIYKFNALPARLIWMLHGKPLNFAITLPHPFKRAAVIHVARNFITAPHRKHEEGGHVPTLERLGSADYVPTHLWHTVALRRPCTIPAIGTPLPANMHEMEREACERAAALTTKTFAQIGTVPAA